MKKFIISLLMMAVMTTTHSAFAALSPSIKTEALEQVSSADNNWDSILDDFDKYVNDYIKLMKKYKEGDMSAMTQAASMLETANSLSKKLENADKELTSAQITRYTKIVQKLSNAALEML